ncbi:MAG: ASKHA domain-containing protein [Anaerolineae bacterium]
MTTFHVDFEPVGRRATAGPHQTLLEAAHSVGVRLAAVCGGRGLCGKCRVRLLEGELSPPTEVERRLLGEAATAAGERLACQACPCTDVKLYLPPASLTAPQRLQVEGQEIGIAVDPIVVPVDVVVEAPTLQDLRADTVRLTDALRRQGVPRPFFDQPVLSDLSERLRAQEWRARLALRHRPPPAEVVGVLPPGAALLGLAVDVGTTKMAGYLVDLGSGRTLAQAGCMNPQIAYGEDVVSRIAYANEHPQGRGELQTRLIEGLNALTASLCAEIGVAPQHLVEAVVVGNTAMHHLFAGLPVRQLGEAPYLAAVSESLDICARHLGLTLAPGAKVYLPPNIAGYVGADHVAMLLATGAWQAERPTVALDIGTNTEISLIVDGRVLSCSCASGPAFEGAHIHAGMRAAPGAVEHVSIIEGEVHVQTIEGKPPVGICGSGILDAVAALRKAGIINRAGRLQTAHPRVRPWEGRDAFLLVPAPETGHGHDLWVTRRDVNEIQLAKGAIRAGVEVLLREAGLTADELAAFIVAGAFGTYLDVGSAVEVGMFPPLPLSRFRQVGNAAGAGARQMLISARRRAQVAALVEQVEYVELTTHPAFTDAYMTAIMF